MAKYLALLLVLLPLLLNLSSTNALYTFPSAAIVPGATACNPLGVIPATYGAPIWSPSYRHAYARHFYAPSIFSAGYHAFNPYYQYNLALAGISPALYGAYGAAARAVVSPWAFSGQQQLYNLQLQAGYLGLPYSYMTSRAAYAYPYMTSPAAYAYPYMSSLAAYAYPTASLGVF